MVTRILDHIEASVSPFHAVDRLCRMLDEAGAVRLQECDHWTLERGRSYYVTRNLSSVIAFSIPEIGFSPFQICASHSDSPTFKIKENAEIEVRNRYVQLDVERYGGMILSTWLDRPLSVAGRALIRTEKGIETRLVNIDRDLLLIPNVAPHMNREINNGYKYNPGVDLMPLYGDIGSKGTFRKMIAENIGVTPDFLLGSDLFLYNRMKSTVWGADNEYISSPRLDDLECAFTSMTAFLTAKATDHINMCCVFDNEEVGSGTKQGADSTLLSDVTERIAQALNADSEDHRRAMASSFMLSADNAHATNPNHPEYADAQNQVFMNEGIVIKFNANQKYTSDGVSEAVFHEILNKHSVPYQHFANRSDLMGGSTLGNISGAHVSINSLDIGLAQLAMHSSYETAGAKDVDHMIDGIRAFYETDIACTSDGFYTLR